MVFPFPIYHSACSPLLYCAGTACCAATAVGWVGFGFWNDDWFLSCGVIAGTAGYAPTIGRVWFYGASTVFVSISRLHQLLNPFVNLNFAILLFVDIK